MARASGLPPSEVVLVGKAHRLPTGVGGASVVRVDVEKSLRGRVDASLTLFLGGDERPFVPAWYGEWTLLGQPGKGG